MWREIGIGMRHLQRWSLDCGSGLLLHNCCMDNFCILVYPWLISARRAGSQAHSRKTEKQLLGQALLAREAIRKGLVAVGRALSEGRTRRELMCVFYNPTL